VAFGYCVLCQRNVPLRRNFGIGSLIAVLAKCGAWLLAVSFYSRRCAICKGAAISRPTPSRSRRFSLVVLAIAFGSLILIAASKHPWGTPRRRSPVGRYPARPATAVTVKAGAASSPPAAEQSFPGTASMPKLYDSNGLLCGSYRNCTTREFAAAVQVLAATWELMPENSRLQCVSQDTVPGLSNCIVNEQMDFLVKHADEDLSQLEQQNPWLYERDRNGKPIQPAVDPIE
jgi:hypothetical protein